MKRMILGLVAILALVPLLVWGQGSETLTAIDASHLAGNGDPNTVGCSAAPCDCSRTGKDRFTDLDTDEEWYCSDEATDEWTLFAGGEGGGSLTVQNPTSTPYSVTGACDNVLVSNAAFAGTLRINLCDAVAGMEVYVVWDDATRQVDIEPTADNRILDPDTNNTGDGLRWTAGGNAGSIIHLISTSDNSWRVVSVRGTALTDNNTGGS